MKKKDKNGNGVSGFKAKPKEDEGPICCFKCEKDNTYKQTRKYLQVSGLRWLYFIWSFIFLSVFQSEKGDDNGDFYERTKNYTFVKDNNIMKL